MPVLHLFVREHEDVLGDPEVADRAVEAKHLPVLVPVGTERLGLDDQQIHVGVRPGVAAPSRPEEDDLLRVDLVDDGADHAVEEFGGDGRR